MKGYIRRLIYMMRCHRSGARKPVRPECAELDAGPTRRWGSVPLRRFWRRIFLEDRLYGVLRPGGNYHCYNVVGDCRFDLTSEQFGDEKLVYEGNPEQFREVHFCKRRKTSEI